VPPRPVFLLSLPRAGSTLVQRVLASHPEVATAPEPWLLLPQLFSFRERGSWALYGHVPASRAIREFAARLPNGDADYVSELRRFILALYAKASPGKERYFVDKTPRYHLIAEELRVIFPEARWIFLWRNPLAVAASMITTWGRDRWRPERWRLDLVEGPRNLVEAYERHPDEACAVRYEDLVEDPEVAWPRLFAHLDLEFDPSSLTSLASLQLPARMGDRTGSARYSSISAEPLDKWRAVMATSVRKRWCRAYLKRLGAHRLGVMGYDLDSLLTEVDALPTDGRRFVEDLANSTFSVAQGATRRAATRLIAPRRTLWPDRWPS
jgi:Sulfotransferase family